MWSVKSAGRFGHRTASFWSFVVGDDAATSLGVNVRLIQLVAVLLSVLLDRLQDLKTDRYTRVQR